MPVTDSNGQSDYRTYLVTMTVVCLAFIVLAGKLYFLQVVDHSAYLSRSEQNAMRRVPLKAVRGRILDRDGNIIVGNRPAYTVSVIPTEARDLNRLDSVLAPVLDLPANTIARKAGGRRRRWHRPVALKRDTPFNTIAYLEENRHDFPSIMYLVESRRRYPHGHLAAHVVGYVREIPERQLANLRNRGYAQGDLMGQTGIEAQYESQLRGTKGEEYQEVNASGRVIHSQRNEPVRGEDVRLTLDLQLQRVAEEAMDRVPKGALVALDPRNGEVLALVSRPTFTPDVFSFVVPTEVWNRLNDNELRPLFNRACMGTYPPGSTAKMITAIGGLERNLINVDTRLEPCTGTMWYGNRTFSCWASWGHGALNVVHAIEMSCNIFFYQLGERLGLDAWGETAQKFRFGQATGIDLPAEDDGLVPSTDVYDQRYGRGRWGGGEALNVGIGQGITLVTPVQMARYVASLGTGYLVTPHLAKSFIDPEGKERVVPVAPSVPLDVDQSVLDIIRRGMLLVTEGQYGTAHRATAPGFHTAGKTGTAQNPHGEDHSWFVGYAPADDPVIAVAIICENAGHGSDVAAPIAGVLFREWLLRPEASETTASR